MTTSRLSRLRDRIPGRTSIDGFRRKELEAVAATVGSFAELRGPDATDGWIEADDHPVLFERDPDALEQELIDLWLAHGRSELVPLAGPVARLAEQARAKPLRSEQAVSSTVYAMQ